MNNDNLSFVNRTLMTLMTLMRLVYTDFICNIMKRKIHFYQLESVLSVPSVFYLEKLLSSYDNYLNNGVQYTKKY